MRGLVFGLAPALLAQAPGPAWPEGWKVERTVTFAADNLYGHIDGGAELFLEYGFDRLAVTYLVAQGWELTLESYQMTSPEAALGVYLSRCGRETPIKALSVRHTAGPHQILALKGRTLIMLNNARGKAEDLAPMAAVLQPFLATLKDEPAGDLWADLPTEGRVRGSEFLGRGPYALQPVVTLGEDDILSQKGRHWAAGVDRTQPTGAPSTHLVVRYPDEATAEAAWKHLRTHLDATVTVVASQEKAIRFRDFQKSNGRLRWEGTRIFIDLRLAEKP